MKLPEGIPYTGSFRFCLFSLKRVGMNFTAWLCLARFDFDRQLVSDKKLWVSSAISWMLTPQNYFFTEGTEKKVWFYSMNHIWLKFQKRMSFVWRIFRDIYLFYHYDAYLCLSGWWFQTFCIFHFIYGLSSFPLMNSYFSRWLLHHQPDILFIRSGINH